MSVLFQHFKSVAEVEKPSLDEPRSDNKPRSIPINPEV